MYGGLHCRPISHSWISEYSSATLKTGDLSKSVEFFQVEDTDDMIESPLSSVDDLSLGSVL